MKCRPYLTFRKFTVLTDHKLLRWLLNLRLPSGRLARWALLLQEYDYDVLHKPGAQNRVPDALSRLPTDGDDHSPLDLEVTATCLTGMRKGQNSLTPKDDHYDDDPSAEDEARFLESQQGDPWIQYVLEKGYLFKANNQSAYRRHPMGNVQLAVPASLYGEVLEAHHDAPSRGHPRATRMYFTLSRRYYWPFMHLDVASMCCAESLVKDFVPGDTVVR